MKIFLVLLLGVGMILCGCVSNKIISLKMGDVYTVKVDERNLFSIHIPSGDWGTTTSSITAASRGWIGLNGQPSNSSPFGYAVQFSIAPAEKYGMNVIDVLKSQDFVAFTNAVEPASSPKMLAEMQAINYGQKLIRVGSYNCKNSWYQQTLASQINGGRGIPMFRNFIECPLVIDGRVFVFAISTDSGIRPAFIQWQAEQNKDKAPNEQITIDTKDHLSHLGDKVLAIFGTIQFHGKVSQSYSDILDPARYDKDRSCNYNHMMVETKECPLLDQSEVKISLTKGQVLLIKRSLDKSLQPRSMFALTIPDGIWSINQNASLDKGRINIYGETDSVASYRLQFYIYQPGELRNEQQRILSAMKSNDLSSYLTEPYNAKSLAMIRRDDGRHFGERQLAAYGLQCKNWWYQMYMDPDHKGRPEAGVFNSIIHCPLVLDGRLLVLEIWIKTAIKEDFYKRDGVAIIMDDYLKGLANNITLHFDQIQFHGKVSQKYEDILNPG